MMLLDPGGGFPSRDCLNMRCAVDRRIAPASEYWQPTSSAALLNNSGRAGKPTVNFARLSDGVSMPNVAKSSIQSICIA